jgi:hypothetical protein
MPQKNLDHREITVKTPYGTKKFVFIMNRHFCGDDNTAMQEIADWIVKSADNPAWLKGPLWMHRDGTLLRYAQIYKDHKLWHLF